MSDSDYAIRVNNLGKQYRLGDSGGSFYRYKSLGDTLGNLARRPIRTLTAGRGPMTDDNSFWALKDVNFEVKKGEVVGIIGRNGAGKSTLLKILSRITKPTTGCIDLYGRVGSLLEVGTGFHPELSGRENIYLNGAILGMTHAEVRSKFDEIVAFSEVERFLDTPVKHYSSGMYTRLAFAVAANLEPEVLVVDEVLAVGDEAFQKKCLGRMKLAADDGRTVLFVSHNMSAIQTLCTHGIFLANGEIGYQGLISPCIEAYQSSTTGNGRTIVQKGQSRKRGFSVSRLTINGGDGDEVQLGPHCRELDIYVEGRSDEALKLDLELFLKDIYGAKLGQASPTRQHGNLGEFAAGPFSLRTRVLLPHLNHGVYQLHIMLNDPLHEGFWECVDGVTIYSTGTPLCNGSVVEASSGGALLLSSSTAY